MIGVIIQARTGSTRFPRKIYEDLNGKSTLYRVLEGATANKMPHKIILAMPEYDEEEFNSKLCRGEFAGAIDDRFCVYFGHPDDLVDRYYQAAVSNGIDLVVRLTADCPFGGVMVDEMLIEYLKCGYNGFMGNNELISEVAYPDGMDIEIFPFYLLAETKILSKSPYEREHVTPFMYRRGTEYEIYSFLNIRPNTMVTTKFSNFSFDTEEDRKLLLEITKHYDHFRKEDLDASNVEILNKALKASSFPELEWKKK